MRKNKKDLNAYENDMINISNKEQEILESYKEDFIEYNEKVNYDDEEFDYKEVVEEKLTKQEDVKKPIIETKQEEVVIIEEDVEETSEVTEEEKIEETTEATEELEENNEEVVVEKKDRNYKKIINICFSIIMAILIMITIDVISVARYNKGPYFTIPVKEYKDGGTKEYIGFGYKVIDYNQIQGRRDKEIGFLNLKYNIEPIDMKDIDLAIEFTNNEEVAYKTYYKKFIRIESTLEYIDLENNGIIIGYNDEGGKYTFKISCAMASDKEELVNINVQEKVYVIGTVTDYQFETSEKPGKLILSNCFASR